MLPALKRSMQTESKPSQNVTHPVTDAILMVDDEPEIIRLVQILLGDVGLTVHTACDGADALHYVRERGMPRLFLLDLQMPVLDGPGFLNALRAEFPAPAPILVLSAAIDIKKVASDLKANGFIAKPFQVEELKTAVLGILRADKG